MSLALTWDFPRNLNLQQLAKMLHKNIIIGSMVLSENKSSNRRQWDKKSIMSVALLGNTLAADFLKNLL